MATAKVKKIKIPLGESTNADMNEMFNQMIGAGNVNMSIAWPRYCRLRGLTDQIIRVMEMLAGSPFMNTYKTYETVRDELLAWCAESRKTAAELFAADFSDYEWELDSVEEEQVAEFSKAYEAMKKSPLIRSFVIMCDRLVLHKRQLAAGSSKFIDLMPGASWVPFPFSRLDIKFIFAQHDDDITRRFFMVVMAKAYELSYEVWNEITSPDVDLEQFSEIIMNSIQQVKKRPELSRCGRAFKKIESSIGLLKDRFGSYYRDFIQTKNASIIMEHYILDVSKDAKTDPETTRQFREIIKFYRSQTQRIDDPKIRSMIDKVNASLSDMDSIATNLVDIASDDEAEEKENDAAAEEVSEYDRQLAARRAELDKLSVDELAALIEG